MRQSAELSDLDLSSMKTLVDSIGFLRLKLRLQNICWCQIFINLPVFLGFSHFSSASSPPSSTASTAAVPGPPVAAVPRPAVPTGSPTALKAMSGTLGTTTATPGPASGAVTRGLEENMVVKIAMISKMVSDCVSTSYQELSDLLQPLATSLLNRPFGARFFSCKDIQRQVPTLTRELPVPSLLQTAKCTWKLILCRALALSEYIIYRLSIKYIIIILTA